MKKLIVPNKYNEKKLNKFLIDNIPNIRSSNLYKLLRKKDIKVNGKRVNRDVTIYTNDEIIVYISDNLLTDNFKLDIFYEDDNILIVNKPANLEVTGNNSLTTQIHKKYNRVAEYGEKW